MLIGLTSLNVTFKLQLTKMTFLSALARIISCVYSSVLKKRRGFFCLSIFILQILDKMKCDQTASSLASL